MCRLTAYIGADIPLENIIVKPTHSLLVQSHDAQEAKLAVNGDGFGIAWYGRDGLPGLYKDVFPAWSDSNLPSICRMVHSRLFLAHVRASTVGETSRENCHPFTHCSWSFMHNGGIAEFGRLRRPLENLLSDQFYGLRTGNTDSELLFLLLLTNGLQQDPHRAVERTIDQVLQISTEQNTVHLPVRLTCVLSDGSEIFAFRFANDDKSPSLYVSECLDHGGRAIASEPLEDNHQRWEIINPGEFLRLNSSRLVSRPIQLSGGECHSGAA